MPPKPVKRDSPATKGRYGPLDIPPYNPLVVKRPQSPTPVDVPPGTPPKAADIVKNVYRVFMSSNSDNQRAQALYDVFSDLSNELQNASSFTQVIQLITDDLHGMGFKPSTLPSDTPSPCTPCTLNHDPVTVTVTKEVHPASCAAEMMKLRKELSDLKSGINALANLTHLTESTVLPSLSVPPSPSPSSLSSLPESFTDFHSASSTPKASAIPLTELKPPKSFAYVAKANTAHSKSPKEIIRDREAKSCTSKGTPSNFLVLSDFKSTNTAASYRRIAEMRKTVNDSLAENKCKSVAWSSHGNLVVKCARSISPKDKSYIINAAKASFGNEPTVLNKTTKSYVKFIDVPRFDIEGTPFDINDFDIMIQQNEKWSDVNITDGPKVVVKKDSPDAKKATIKIGFADDKHSTTAKKLLKTTILFGGIPIRCKPWTSLPPAPSSKRASNASSCPSDVEVSSIA
ncbi:hypothetical protein M378DRAFT_18677 [Amanita muscaria Koide BX008]|uniref:Uncharacterized protein n=1 Tax=Amanita muscaria (strain Koide BX008) TaxID=946122 RepID=A0A0C2RWK4_AMAMK|nr:hypothetical protein M378DRAFT_18677 [Amanita muscaria Koide BX008]